MTNIIPKELILPPRIMFRNGAVHDLLKECVSFGRKGLLVHGCSLVVSGTLQKILHTCLEGADVRVWQHTGGEPTLRQLEHLLAVARESKADWIAGVGGGSVIDIAKACAGLLEAPLSPVAYHDGKPVPQSRVPFIAVPTTAGTGSEATIVCVLTNSETNVKKSFRHQSLMARLVVLDPELLEGAPSSVIAHSGMDALTQAVESYVSAGASWFTDQLSLKAIGLIASSLEAFYRDSRNRKAADLLLGAHLAGQAFSNARLGIVHGLAHPLGARYHVPHGLACAVCLPLALEFNRKAIAEKYDKMSKVVGHDLLGDVHRLMDALEIKSPFAGKEIQDEDRIVAEVLASGSTAANPRKVSAEDVRHLLKAIFAGKNSL